MSFICKYCGMEFSNLEDLLWNSCSKNPNGGKHVPYEGSHANPFYCKYCGMEFSNLEDLLWNSCSKNPNSGKHEPL